MSSRSLLYFFVVLLLSFAPRAAAEELYSDSGFFIDLPEGFIMTEGDGRSHFAFTDPTGTLVFQIILYEPTRYRSASAIGGDVSRKLSAKADSESFSYQRRDAALADLHFSLNGEPQRGWGVFINGAPKNASGLEEKDIALLAYTPEDRYQAYLPFILSCLDGFSIDEEARLYPGPISQFNFPWNPALRVPAAIRFEGHTLDVPLNPEEERAAQDTVEREYLMLSAYEGTDSELAFAAWRRFYRMIYRESFHRLDYIALALSRELASESDSRARMGRLLAWTQGFQYERDESGSDYVNPLTAAAEGRGDCDSRAVLLAVLARHDNEDALLLISVKYSHALVGFDLEGPGARFPYDGKGWLVGETTDDVGLGLIDSTMANPADWMAVDFPR